MEQVLDHERCYLSALTFHTQVDTSTSKFFNTKNHNASDASKYSKISNSITLIVKSEKYPVGHYLLRTKEGWVDSWYNLPSIDNVHAGIRKKLPSNPWYVLYPITKN
jgi:hypothetical protein